MKDNIITFPGTSGPEDDQELPKDTPEAPPFGPTTGEVERLIGDDICTGYIVLARVENTTRMVCKGFSLMEGLGMLAIANHMLQDLNNDTGNK